jgi:penicillin-binding protein 2
MKDTRRLRLFVVQALVLSLFATLFARLWYIQVATGADYREQASDNAVEGVIIPPERGLILDSQGRPLAAGRTSWVVTIDRTTLDEMGDRARERVLRRVADMVGMRYKGVVARSKLCGEPGALEAPDCWSGSPYQPVPIAEDVPQRVAISIQEQSEDFPAISAERWQARAYPAPLGVNAAHVLGYLSPITDSELESAQARNDRSLNRISLVGRSGVERTYDRWLRGMPGVQRKAVDSLGRVISTVGVRPPQPGSSLVTSIDARVQAVAERQLRRTIFTARRTFDPVTGRNYVADSGAVIVMDPTNGRVIAMASFPSYNPNVWVGGISSKRLSRLYSAKAGTPLLSRATQGQFAPGSTFKPIMTSAALTHGFSRGTRLNCSSAFQVGTMSFNNYESAAYGYIGFPKALQVSCNSFFYRIGYHYWLRSGGDSGDVHAPDPLVRTAERFGFGSETGIDLPGEASGRIADRGWKRAYWKSQRDYYCKLGRENEYDYIHRFAREFCTDGWRYRAGDAVNFAIGQGDTIVTPLQLATAYSAIANGGTLWKPRVGKAIISPQGRVVKRIKPQKASEVPVPDSTLDYIDHALLGTTRTGTSSWRFIGFPLDQVKIRSKTGSAEVYGKQSTSWLATYNKHYTVVMMVSQGGTGSGTSGPGVRRIWEALYGVRGGQVHRARAAQPGAHPPAGLPTVGPNGAILPPGRR